MSTIQQLLVQAQAIFNEISPTARLDAEMLLCTVLEKARAYLYAHPQQVLNTEQSHQFHAYCKRRLTGEPVAYLIGHCEFWSLDLVVTKAVLIPRPETETLVEQVLAHLPVNETCRVVDMGTGSGAIALALASERPQWQIVATDISAAALAIAKNNAGRLGLKNIEFRLGSWCDPIAGEKYSALVSNPPYIKPDDLHLKQNGLPFEPRQALVAEDAGYAAYKNLIENAKNHLLSDGYIFFEHGYAQAEQIEKLLQNQAFAAITRYNDLNQIPRVIMALSFHPD